MHRPRWSTLVLVACALVSVLVLVLVAVRELVVAGAVALVLASGHLPAHDGGAATRMTAPADGNGDTALADPSASR